MLGEKPKFVSIEGVSILANRVVQIKYHGLIEEYNAWFLGNKTQRYIKLCKQNSESIYFQKGLAYRQCYPE